MTISTCSLGRSELEVSVVGLGCNQIGRKVDGRGTARLLDACEEAGVTLLDTADIYGGGGASESLLGEALDGRRDRFVVATKFGMELSGVEGVPEAPRGSREYIRWAVEGSLRRLRVDRIDLYQYHRPDSVTPLEETLGALDELVEEGVVRYLGCSNFGADQIERSAGISSEQGSSGFVSVQNEYNLLERGLEADVAPACERHRARDLAVLPAGQRAAHRQVSPWSAATSRLEVRGSV